MKIWDIYTRVFHWLFASSVIFAIIIADINTNIHFETSKFITTLVIFRVIWGFVGYKTARFNSFLPTKAKIRNYLRGNYKEVGHNPIGAISVFVILSLVVLQILTGLFTTDDVLFEAPLYHLVGGSIQELIQETHHILSTVLITIIIVHIGAIIVYWLLGKNLVKDMVRGGETEKDLSVKYIHLKAFISIIISLFVTYLIFY